VPYLDDFFGGDGRLAWQRFHHQIAVFTTYQAALLSWREVCRCRGFVLFQRFAQNILQWLSQQSGVSGLFRKVVR
jgi:hypothetical protein